MEKLSTWAVQSSTEEWLPRRGATLAALQNKSWECLIFLFSGECEREGER